MPPPRDDLLDRARRAPGNFSLRDLERLYLSYGFVITRHTRHSFATHPVLKFMRGTIPNHKPFSPGYVRDAVKLIDLVLARG